MIDASNIEEGLLQLVGRLPRSCPWTYLPLQTWRIERWTTSFSIFFCTEYIQTWDSGWSSRSLRELVLRVYDYRYFVKQYSYGWWYWEELPDPTRRVRVCGWRPFSWCLPFLLLPFLDWRRAFRHDRSLLILTLTCMHTTSNANSRSRKKAAGTETRPCTITLQH